MSGNGDTDEIPEGWARATVGGIVEVNYGKALKEDNRKPGVTPVYGSNGVVGRHDVSFTRGPTIIIGRKGSVGEVHFSPSPCWPIDTTYYIDDLSNLDTNFAFRLMQSLGLPELDTSSAIPGLNRDQLYGVEVLLPPLAEQKRIVAKVEALFARVNAARQRLAKVPALLKRFRQSVLAAACSGQLTEDWREENPVEPADTSLAKSAQTVDTKAIRHLVRRGTVGLPEAELPDVPETWVIRTVRQLVEEGAVLDFQDGNHGSLYPRSTDFGEDGVKFLTAQQVFDNSVLLADTPLLRHETAKQLRIGFTKPRDVLLTHNATVGRVAILPDYEGDIILGTSVTYYRTNPAVLMPEFLCFEMQGKLWQDQLRSVMEQTTRNQVSVTKQVEFRLVVPPLAEQHKIVRRVSSLLSRADGIEKRLTSATRRVESLTRAILAQAFKGELVPTEAELARREGRDYEPASILLERIRATVNDGQQAPRKRSTGKSVQSRKEKE